MERRYFGEEKVQWKNCLDSEWEKSGAVGVRCTGLA